MAYYIKVSFVVCVAFNLMSCHFKADSERLDITTLPSLNILTIDSTLMSTDSLKPNNIFSIIYISTECSHCKMQIKEIKDHMASLGDIQFLVVSNYPLKDLRKFYQDNSLAYYPNIIVGHDYNSSVMSSLNIRQVPFIAVFDENRHLLSSTIGVVKFNQLLMFSQDRASRQ